MNSILWIFNHQGPRFLGERCPSKGEDCKRQVAADRKRVWNMCMCHHIYHDSSFWSVADIALGNNQETYVEENPKKYELVDEETAKKRQRMQQFRFISHFLIFAFANIISLAHFQN